MRNFLKLAPNVPVEIALSCTDGVNVISPRGTHAVKYTLVDGRTFFATAYVDAKFKKLKVEACERIVLCMRKIDGKNITVVERPRNLEPPSQQQNSPPGDGGGLSLVIASRDECQSETFVQAADHVSFEPETDHSSAAGDSPFVDPHASKTELMNELSLVIANAEKDQPGESVHPTLCGLEPPSFHRNGASESKSERSPCSNGDETQPARPISLLERALKTAILAAHSAEQYGEEIGYVVRFDQESVKSMAVTVLIGMQGGRY